MTESLRQIPPDFDQPYTHDEIQELLSDQQLIARLPPIERFVIEQRYPPAAGGQTLDFIGREMGITRERVRQLEVDGMKKLRAILGSMGIDGPA